MWAKLSNSKYSVVIRRMYTRRPTYVYTTYIYTIYHCCHLKIICLLHFLAGHTRDKMTHSFQSQPSNKSCPPEEWVQWKHHTTSHNITYIYMDNFPPIHLVVYLWNIGHLHNLTRSRQTLFLEASSSVHPPPYYKNYLWKLKYTPPAMRSNILSKLIFATYGVHIIKIKIHSSCQIEYFVDTHLCKLRVILRSSVLRVVCPH